MNASAVTPALDTCGCCDPGVPQPQIYNWPGLQALAYRLGTHPSFLQRLLARLPAYTLPAGANQGAHPLAGLTTRSTDDPAIALLDAWAIVADVLTFYQERLANEGFLRTATERRSVLELARTIGYRLRPGVAAGTFLAFSIEEAPGAPTITTVPQGAKVQSIPGPGQSPQTFETSTEITARPEWNALRPRLTQPQPLDPDATSLYLVGIATNLKANDTLLLAPTPSSGLANKVVRIRRVESDAALNRTRVDLEDIPAKPPPPVVTVHPPAKLSLSKLDLTATQVQSNILGQSWRERDLTAFLAIQGWSRRSVVKHVNTPPPLTLPPADSGVFAFRARLGFFGHNAPLYDSLPTSDNTRGDPYRNGSWDAANNNTGRDIWTDSQGNPYDQAEADVYLERSVPEVLSNSWLVVESPTVQPTVYRVGAAAEASLADYGLSGRATGLRLTHADGTSAPDKPGTLKVRKTTAYVQSERLELADLPIADPIAAGTTVLQLDQMLLGLQIGQALALSGERHDLPGVTSSEIVILADILHSDGFTLLTFEDGLQYTYARQTVTLNANVVRATHGETVVEVLGSGDSSQANQRFALKKPPLTYVSASTASGTLSTLQVRINDILWEEVASLYPLQTRDEAYLVEIDDDSKPQVIFGDGQMGARLPSGMQNVVATYRSGIGLTGMVEADTLTLLQTRPLGVRSVTNPLPASGADDPENRDSARSNAPLTVLTLDRIVSLRDFEDFARGFAGIGKAQAVALWKGETQFVHLTIAAVAAAAAPDVEASASALATHIVDSQAELYINLVEAVSKASDPAQQFLLDTYQPLFFNVKSRVLVDPRFTAAAVLEAVDSALKVAFAFEARTFGQPVTAAEVVTAIQRMPGVVACTLIQLYRYEDDQAAPEPEEVITPELLEVQSVHWSDTGDALLPAELLLINPVGITLEEMTP